MVNKKQTSPRVAHDASGAMRDPKASKRTKEFAASAEAQANRKRDEAAKKKGRRK